MPGRPILIIVFLFFGLLAKGQDVHQLLRQSKFQPLYSFQEKPSASLLQSSILPGYARQNPTGYSFLCRKELEIERKSPVGVWMKVDENRQKIEGLPQSQANLRFRIKLW